MKRTGENDIGPLGSWLSKFPALFRALSVGV
jgi:hypothetical protein